MAEKTFEQYEVWVDNHGKWERVALFRHVDVASAVFGNRTYRQKLMHVTYDENGKKLAEETLAEIGRTREQEHIPEEPAAPRPQTARASTRRKAS